MQRVRMVVIGAGGLAREVRWLIETEGTYAFAGYLQTDVAHVPTDGGPWYGTLAQLQSDPGPLALALGVAHPPTRLALWQQLRTLPQVSFPNLIHPSCVIDPATLRLGRGNLLLPGCLVAPDVTLGHANCLNRGCSLGHDVTLGHANCLNPGVILSGNVTLGHANLLGTRATVLQGLTMGSTNLLAAAALLTRSVADGGRYVGTPARRLGPWPGPEVQSPAET